MTKQDKVAKVMHEWKQGKLTSHGKVVKDYDQAIAIALSEAGLSKKYERGGGVEENENALMVANNNKQIAHHTREMENALKDTNHVPAWVVAKVNRSASDLSDATHYLEGQGDKYEGGGDIGKFAYGQTEMLKAELKNNLRDLEMMNKVMLENDMPKSYVNDAMRLQVRNEDLVKELKNRGVKIEDMKYSKGGNIIERRYVNREQDYEVRYAKDKPARKGYKNERKFAVGGSIESEINELYKKSKFINDDFNWEAKLLEMLQDQSVEAYQIYQSLNEEEKESVLQELYEMDNDMGSCGDEDMEMSKENLSILLEDSKNGKKYAKGGMLVTKIKDIPNFKERLDEGRITYRGLGMGKLYDDFYKLTGTNGTRIKVDGKEYFITDEEFDTFSRDENGKLRIRFDAPKRKFAKGGGVESVWSGFNQPILSFSKVDYDVNVNRKNMEVDVNIKESDSVSHQALNDTNAEWSQYNWGYMVYPKTLEQLYNVLKALRTNVSKSRLENYFKGDKYAVGGEVGNDVTFSWFGDRMTGRIANKLPNGYEVSTDDGMKFVEPQEVISFSEPVAKKKRFGFFAEGGGVESSLSILKKEVNEYSMNKYGEPIDEETFMVSGLKKDDEDVYFRFIVAETVSGKDIKLTPEQLFDVDREDKFAGGGEIQSQIDKLQFVVNSKMLPESVKENARKKIAELEKELHESKETKAEERKFKIGDFVSDSDGNIFVVDRLLPFNKRFNSFEVVIKKKGLNTEFIELESNLHESKETKAEEKAEHEVGGSENKEKLEKELHRLQRDLNSSRLQTYREGDNSEEEKARQRERASKLARFNEVLALLNKKEEKPKAVKKSEKVKLSKIKILWAEGDTSKYDKFPKEYSSWELANKAVIPVYNDTLGDEGYNKLKFEVTFKDGETYDGRLDVSEKEDNPTKTNNVIGKHIKEYLDYLSSEKSSSSEKEKEEIKEWLEKYDLGLDKATSTTRKAPIKKAVVKKPSKQIVDYFKNHTKKETYLYNNRIGFNKGMQSKEQYDANHEWISKQIDKKPKAVAKKVVKKDLPKIKVGDTIKVYATNGDLIIDEIFKNSKGEVSYRGKYIDNENLKSYHSSKKTYEYILNEQDTIIKPKADHKKLVAKLKAKKGTKEYDNRASLNTETGERRKRNEASDKKRDALPLGKRVSEDGNVYWENRLNRGDLSKKDKFEKGGEVDKNSSSWGLNLNW